MSRVLLTYTPSLAASLLNIIFQSVSDTCLDVTVGFLVKLLVALPETREVFTNDVTILEGVWTPLSPHHANLIF